MMMIIIIVHFFRNRMEIPMILMKSSLKCERIDYFGTNLIFNANILTHSLLINHIEIVYSTN